MGLGVGTLMAALFDVRHYFHLQLIPHISRDHQVREPLSSISQQDTERCFKYWRLLTSPFVLGDSSDLVVMELVLYEVSVQIERAFGTL